MIIYTKKRHSVCLRVYLHDCKCLCIKLAHFLKVLKIFVGLKSIPFCLPIFANLKFLLSFDLGLPKVICRIFEKIGQIQSV